MDNLKHYNALKSVPKDALKEIQFGKLKGKSDISPQWRYEAMTTEFGACGVGWYFEIADTFTKDLTDGQTMLFVKINLYIKSGDDFSKPIPGFGGDFLVIKDKNGVHGNDEAYKMATTDALGAALKMIGVAADVYRGLANDSKYGRQQSVQLPPQQARQQPYSQPPAVQEDKLLLQKVAATAKAAGLSPTDMQEIMQLKYKQVSSVKLTQKQLGDLLANMSKYWEDVLATKK